MTTTCQAVSHSPWADAAVIATALGALTFVVLYAWSTRGAWRDSIVGLNVMSMMTVILAVSALAAASLVFGTNWSHRDLIRTAAWGSVAVVIWWRVAILWRVQRCPAAKARHHREHTR